MIIPTYNRAHTIGRAVESVLSQAMAPAEVLVVDDASTDDTAVRLARLAVPSLRVIRHPGNRGAQAARNTGIRHARHPWVAFLDSDDVWLPDSLGTRLREAERTGSEVVSAAGLMTTPAGGTVPIPWIPAKSGDIYAALLREPGPMFQGLLASKASLERIGLLDEGIRAFQEWDTVIRLSRNHPFGYVASPAFVYDCSGNDAISRDLHRDVRGYLQIVHKHRDEIVRVCGRSALAGHWTVVAEKYQHLGLRRFAGLYRLKAMLLKLRTVTHL